MTTTSEEPPEEVPSDQQLAFRRWRYDEARRMHLTIVEAKLFADTTIPVSDLRHLVELGCPDEWLAKVIL